MVVELLVDLFDLGSKQPNQSQNLSAIEGYTMRFTRVGCVVGGCSLHLLLSAGKPETKTLSSTGDDGAG